MPDGRYLAIVQCELVYLFIQTATYNRELETSR